MLVALLLGCAPSRCDVTVTDVHTVLRADVTTREPTRVQVTWTADGRDAATPLSEEAATEHHALLLDLPPLVDVLWTVLDEAGEEVCSGEAETGNLPGGTPTFTGGDDPTVPPWWLIGMNQRLDGQGIRSQIALVRSDGTWVWQWVDAVLDEQVIATDLRPDGVRFNRFDAKRVEDIATLTTLGFDGTTISQQRTELAHHYYTPTADGLVAYLRAERRDVAPYGCVVGDTIVEQDADGVERIVWSAWDALPVAPGFAWESKFYTGCKDWTHGSGLTYRAADDSLVVTMLGLQRMAHVDRATGATLGTYGEGGDVPLAAGAPRIIEPHTARWLDDGRLVVFSTHETDAVPEAGCYAYRVEGGQLVGDRRWVDGEHLAKFLGWTDQLPDGRLVCGWGSNGLVRVFPIDGGIPDWELFVDDVFQFGSIRPYAALPGLERR